MSPGFFKHIDKLKQQGGYNTQYNNTHRNISHLKYLRAIYYKISKTMAGSKEFTYDNTYKTKSDIDLCVTYYDFFRAGKYQLSKDIFFGAAKCLYEYNLFFICFKKTCIYVYDHSEYRNRYRSDYNSFHVISKPYNNHWGQC